MSTDRQQDAGLDRLVRAVLRGETPPEGVVCPDADAVAAYSAGALTARERTELEPHLAACPRCQAVLAMLAQEPEADTVAPPASERVVRPSWWRLPSLGWLVPAGAVALAAVLYVAVKPGLSPLAPSSETSPAASVAPGQTTARSADTAGAAAESAAKPVSEQALARPLGRSETPAAAADELKRTDPAKTETTLALAEKVAVAPPPAAVPAARTVNAPAAPPPTMTAQAGAAPASRPPADAAPGAAAGNLAMAAPQEARQKAVVSAGALDAAAPDIDALWRRADFVVVGRAAVSLDGRLDKGLAGAARDMAAAPAFDVVIVESLKQPAGSKADSRISVVSPRAGAIRVEPGAEYLLFLIREGGADNPVWFSTVGSVGVIPLQADRAEILARLRRLAEDKRK